MRRSCRRLQREGEGTSAEASAVIQRRVEAELRYVDGLPFVPLSRCPLSGQEVELAIDVFGLDGLWWDSEWDLRPLDSLPITFYTLTGAMKLAGPVPERPFIAKLGPEVPFVLPAILRHPNTYAVLSATPVGHNLGYALFTYAAGEPFGVERVDMWGLRASPRRVGGRWRWESRPYVDEECDFDLAPWIQQRKLFWIPPGDGSLTLRSDVAGCPFVGLDGERRTAYMQAGKVWRA